VDEALIQETLPANRQPGQEPVREIMAKSGIAAPNPDETAPSELYDEDLWQGCMLRA
jgi:hypothetical protein